MRKQYQFVSVFVAMIWVGVGCSDEAPSPESDLKDPTGFFSARELNEIDELSPDGPLLPEDPTNAVANDPAASKLGQFLFFDTRLSSDGQQACSTCHQPDHGFADAEPLSTAVGTTTRHSPSVLNSSFYHWYFWDGRADTLWAQATKPLEAPNEQGTTRLEVAHLLARDAELRQAYENVFSPLADLSDVQRFPEEGRPVPDDPNNPHHQAWSSMSPDDQQVINRIYSNVAKALAAYEMKLVSFGAPFDTYVQGLRSGDDEKLAALTMSQKRGLKLFLGKGNCIDCHNGPILSDMAFHNLGLGPRDWLEEGDQGRFEGVDVVKNDMFNATGVFSDAPESTKAKELAFLPKREVSKGAFKTPTVRNVAMTPPYMHGGHFETLEEVVRFYSELDEESSVGQRDATLEKLELSDQEVDDLVAFLRALNGEPLDATLTTAPNSPLLE